MSFDENAARSFIATIPEGSWTTYGNVADAAGNPDAAQHAGNWLRGSGGSIPFYWRVVDANGEVPPGFVVSALGEREAALGAAQLGILVAVAQTIAQGD